jgi:redox-sensitive bicupin YhaK (pirin superfamily)
MFIMIRIRRGNERGHFNHGWLNTFHTFSFGDYNEPQHMGYRSLRVMNEDFIEAGQGFGMHGHRDMEIITYVLEGSLEHRDSLGHGSVLRAGDFQRMTAGSGIRHSEFNPSSDTPLHLYQIWMLPETHGLTPGYEERRMREASPSHGFRLVASRDGREDSLTVHQDANILLAQLKPAASVVHSLSADRHAWLQVLRGEIVVGKERLRAGDGAAISLETNLDLVGVSDAEVMLFDMA